MLGTHPAFPWNQGSSLGSPTFDGGNAPSETRFYLKGSNLYDLVMRLLHGLTRTAGLS
ncbi:unnamed protein product, partial [Allacma fusca]